MIVFTDIKSYTEPIEVVFGRIIDKRMIFMPESESYIEFCNVNAVVLREKDLSDNEYFQLAEKFQALLKGCGIALYLTRTATAKMLGINNLHLTYQTFVESIIDDINAFENMHISVSVHSLAEAIDANVRGANMTITGHIFQTQCKQSLEPRGLSYLRAVVDSVSIPVIAIGGIKQHNYTAVIDCGVSDIAVMSAIVK